MDLIYTVSIWLLPVLIAITFHEAAHGYVARFLGDDTASRLGRVSLNPVRHIDPFGTIILPGLLLIARSPFLFGYAKPVPVNFRALHPPRIGMVLVAAAGLSIRNEPKFCVVPHFGRDECRNPNHSPIDRQHLVCGK